MEDKIKGMLDTEIETEFNEIRWEETTNEGYSAKTERLAKLYNLRIEEKQAESEAELKKQQLTDAKKERWIRIATDAVGILSPLIFYGVWMRRGLEFEQKGSFTSQTFRGLINRFRPTK